MGFLSNIFGNKKAETNASVSFEVSMTCINCVKHVQDLLTKEKGVVDFNVDLDTKSVSIHFDSRITNSTKLQENIEELGFTVSKNKPYD